MKPPVATDLEGVPVVLLVTDDDRLVVAPDRVAIASGAQVVKWYAAGPAGKYQVKFDKAEGSPFGGVDYDADRHGRGSGRPHRGGRFRYTVHVHLDDGRKLVLDPEVDVDPGTIPVLAPPTGS